MVVDLFIEHTNFRGLPFISSNENPVIQYVHEKDKT